jgi:tetratricopeptide (TPR) repeat protein
VASEDPRVIDLTQRAYNAMANGRRGEAAQLWSQLRQIAPNNPQALLHLGQMALQRNETAAAIDLLQRASAAAPDDAIVQLNLAFAFRKAGNVNAEGAAYDKALVADPYCYPALLGKGEVFERLGKPRIAARFFRDALKIEPPAEQMPPQLADQFAHAREAVQANARELGAHLEARLEALKASQPGAKLDRFDQCVGAVLGQKKIYTHQGSLLNFPALPAIQFFDDDEFPWLPELEAATDTVHGELMSLLEEDIKKFRPYVAYTPGTPVNQWHELNHSERWSGYFLWEKGQRIDDHCARCPKTAALMERLPLVHIPGFAPTVMFSVLSPHTHIPPHSGVTNTRLIGHFPLVVPENCRFRVGNETRRLGRGKAWLFDDSIEHEAWNDSDETRIILMIDVWNPRVSEAERPLISELLNGMRDFYREDLAALE